MSSLAISHNHLSGNWNKPKFDFSRLLYQQYQCSFQCLDQLCWRQQRVLHLFPPLLTQFTRPGLWNYSLGIENCLFAFSLVTIMTFVETKICLILRHATSVFGPPPIPGEGRSSRQRPSERHSGSDTVPADIRIGVLLFWQLTWCFKYMYAFKVQYQTTKWMVITNHCRIFYSQNTLRRTRYVESLMIVGGTRFFELKSFPPLKCKTIIIFQVKRSPLTGHRAISPPPKIFTVAFKNPYQPTSWWTLSIPGFAEEYVRAGGGQDESLEHTAQRWPGQQPDQAILVDKHHQQGGGGGGGWEGEQPKQDIRQL